VFQAHVAHPQIASYEVYTVTNTQSLIVDSIQVPQPSDDDEEPPTPTAAAAKRLSQLQKAKQRLNLLLQHALAAVIITKLVVAVHLMLLRLQQRLSKRLRSLLQKQLVRSVQGQHQPAVAVQTVHRLLSAQGSH
jgi:hypothetical protein